MSKKQKESDIDDITTGLDEIYIRDSGKREEEIKKTKSKIEQISSATGAATAVLMPFLKAALDYANGSQMTYLAAVGIGIVTGIAVRHYMKEELTDELVVPATVELKLMGEIRNRIKDKPKIIEKAQKKLAETEKEAIPKMVKKILKDQQDYDPRLLFEILNNKKPISKSSEEEHISNSFSGQ